MARSGRGACANQSSEAIGSLDNIAENFTSCDLLEVKTADGEIDYGKIKLLLKPME